MKKMLLLANYHSGKGIIKLNIADMIDYYTKAGYEITVYSSQYASHITKLIGEKGAEYDHILCCGGDGTLNEAVNGIMSLDKKPNLSYIPCGSTNDFANSINIPTIVEDSYKTAVDGKPIAIDIGKFNDKYFAYVAGFGKFTNISYETPQNIKNILGYQAYLISAIKDLLNNKTYSMKITYDKGVIQDDIMIGLVSNSNSIAGIRKIFENYADLKDGLFEVLLVKNPKNKKFLQNIVTSILEKNFDNDLFYSFKTSKITFECEEDIKWTIDGEYGGDCSFAEISVEKQALNIFVDK